MYCSTVKKGYKNKWKEFLKDWFEKIKTDVHVASWTYRNEINNYGVKYGTSLKVPEANGWINKQNHYEWF